MRLQRRNEVLPSRTATEGEQAMGELSKEARPKTLLSGPLDVDKAAHSAAHFVVMSSSCTTSSYHTGNPRAVSHSARLPEGAPVSHRICPPRAALGRRPALAYSPNPAISLAVC